MYTVELTKFNENFTKFQNRKNITAQEIVTLIKFIENYESQNDLANTITVEISGADYNNNNNAIDFIKNNSIKEDGKTVIYFKCEDEFTNMDTNGDGRIDKIKFTKLS